MNRLTALVRRYPVASAAVLVAVVVGAYLYLSGRPQQRAGVPPAPAATPAAVAPAPAAATPAPPAPAAASPAPAPQVAGRADPFAPLIRARTGAAAAPGPRPVSLPPPAPLPPPLFPGPAASPGVEVPAPAPPPVARLSAGAQLIGVLGDTGRVAIIRVGNVVYIVGQGEMIQDKIRVELVDANEGLVVLIEDGQRFEVRFS